MASQPTSFRDFQEEFKRETGLDWKNHIPTYISYLNFKLESAKNHNIFQLVNRLDALIDEVEKITKKLK